MNDLMLSEETTLDVNIQREESFMSTSELAEALDVGESTVKRAVEELRRSWADFQETNRVAICLQKHRQHR